MRTIAINDASGKRVGAYKDSHALIIGVANYTRGWPKLPSILEEVREIEAVLKKHDFEVKKVLDPDAEELQAAFKDFLGAHGYDRDNRLVVFFSGHGYSRRKGTKGYLVPADAPNPRRDEKGFLQKAMTMGSLLAMARDVEAKHVLFAFDSCFSGTIFKTKGLPATPPHISALTALPVRQFIAAGDAGEEVPAKSVFADCFIRALEGEADLSGDGYVTGTELGMYLHDKVIYYRTGQTPQYGKIRDPDLDRGDIVFALPSPAPAPPRKPEPKPKPEPEPRVAPERKPRPKPTLPATEPVTTLVPKPKPPERDPDKDEPSKRPSIPLW
jgi:uncharacterized caspase-like protein